MLKRNYYLDMLFTQAKAEERKSINLNIDEKLVQEMDKILEQITINSGEHYPRSSIVEVAMRIYLSNLKDEMNRNGFFDSNLDELEQIIIFTSNNNGGEYNSWYQAQDYWRAVHLGKEVVELIRRGSIKYFSLYRSKVYKRNGGVGQCVEEYSEIEAINYISSGKDKGKYEFFLKNRKSLSNPIKLGNLNPLSLQKGRRTTINEFLNASTLEQLFEKKK